jgi:hypothetical protein
MRKILVAFLLLLITPCVSAQNHFDIVVVGGTPGGIMAAVAASREGRTVLILERTAHVGGLPVNGLGATDIATRGATTGLFKVIDDRQYNYYISRYGANSPQAKDSRKGYHFEPHVAANTFDKMLSEEQENVEVLTMRQFNYEDDDIEITDGNIKRIRVLNRATKHYEVYSGDFFIDATYEGDLAAAAGVPYRLGREGYDEFNEIGAGRIYKLWKGPEMEGSTHEGDSALQAYNYRLCLTNDPENRVLPAKPENYNRTEYLSLVDDVYMGRHTGAEMLDVTIQMMEENRKHIESGGRTKIPGDPWGIWKISSMTPLPNKKMDANNQHLAFISTDLPEENQPWPTADWEWRDRFARRLKNYTLGLLWFAQNDEALPEAFREECRRWGLAKDEYQDNDNFPRQVYVREGRRFEGEFFFTANDALPVEEGKRPPLHNKSITASHYALDSHAVRKREEGRAHLDGFLSYPTAVYTVPYGVMVSNTVDNLLFPVPVSGSHIGFSTLRMEPCWMALGQAAGIAAHIAKETNKAVGNISIEALQNRLIETGATLVYYKDVEVDGPDHELVQFMGVRGYLPGWNANLDEAVDEGTAREWTRLSGVPVSEQGVLRRKALQKIYKRLIGGVEF